MPYIIILYPGTINANGTWAITEYYGFSEWENHIPYFVAFFQSLFLDIVKRICGFNIALFVYVIVQCGVFIYLIKKTYDYYIRNKVPKTIWIFTTLFFAFHLACGGVKNKMVGIDVFPRLQTAAGKKTPCPEGREHTGTGPAI